MSIFSSIRASAQKFNRYAESHGSGAAVSASVRRLVRGPSNSSRAAAPAIAGPQMPSVSTGPTRNQTDIIGFYMGFVGREHGSLDALKKARPRKKTLQWVIPNFGFGSGGHLNIFRFINNLAELGYEQHLVILPPYDWTTEVKAKAAIEKWYFPLNASVSLGVDGFKPAQATIATGWQTAYWVAKYQATKERFYFIQDFEPAFYPASSEYFLAENTYRLGLKGITAGTWLSDKLGTDYGMRCGAVSFGCETDFYTPQPKRETPNFNLLFYSRHVTKRRLFELGLCALDEVCRRHPEVAVIFAGGDVSGFKIPFHHLNAGELSLAELPDLYSQSDLALVLSGTNLSLLPLELAACKCPMVLNDTPSSRWLMPDDAAYYAPLDPVGMADVISKAITDQKGRQSRRDAAFAMAQKASWKIEAKKMEKLMRDLSK